VVTVSVGAAWSQPQSPDAPEAQIQTADEQLYLSKQLGRNRVSLHTRRGSSAKPEQHSRINPAG